MEIYVIMVTLNNVKYTQQTLGSIKTNLPCNVVIVDNASTDGTLQVLNDLSKISNQIIMRNMKRISLSAAWNMGLKRAMQDLEFKYAFVINNDIIFEPYSLEHLVAFAKTHPEYVLMSGLNTRIWKKRPNEVAEDACNFSAFLIAKECILKVGLFDENFLGAYFEDNDYALRVKKAGLRMCVVCDFGFYHYGSTTIREGFTKQEQAQQQACYVNNQNYFKRKWGFIP